jgi:2-(1,2-epoxy-1,2-dihydrophenyl)acetyl-CoA isomerase
MADEREPVVLRRDGAVATVTLNQPSLTTAAKLALREGIEHAGADAGVRAVVLSGSGKAFCLGQDLAEHEKAVRADAAAAMDTVDEHFNPIVRAITGMPKPVLAAVGGTCVGAGLGLALACDLRIAAAGARFGTAFTGIGFTLDSGLSATLARALGASRASELALLGDLFTAEQAHEWGMLHSVVPPAELSQAAGELAARLASGPTLAYAELKRALATAPQAPLEDVLAAESAAQRRLAQTADHQNAVSAFLAKKRPEFTGE